MNKTADEIPDIRAVLDVSALQSYARGHVHVGELVIDVADDEGHIAIPAATLAEAVAGYPAGDEHPRSLLRLLTTLPGIAVLKLDVSTVFAMAGTLQMTGGDLARAHAVWAALHHKALLLTTRPAEVRHLVAEDQIHPLPRDDA